MWYEKTRFLFNTINNCHCREAYIFFDFITPSFKYARSNWAVR